MTAQKGLKEFQTKILIKIIKKIYGEFKVFLIKSQSALTLEKIGIEEKIYLDGTNKKSKKI